MVHFYFYLIFYGGIPDSLTTADWLEPKINYITLTINVLCYIDK